MTENTKAHPGEFDALEKALPDELIFTLLERDPDAPATIHFWVDCRRKRARKMADLDAMRAELLQITEAEFIAIEMADRQRGRTKKAAPTKAMVNSKKTYSGMVDPDAARNASLAKVRAMTSDADCAVKDALDVMVVLDPSQLEPGLLDDLRKVHEQMHLIALKLSPHRAALLGEV